MFTDIVLERDTITLQGKARKADRETLRKRCIEWFLDTHPFKSDPQLLTILRDVTCRVRGSGTLFVGWLLNVPATG